MIDRVRGEPTFGDTGRLRTVSRHFDSLTRTAAVPPPHVPAHLARLAALR